MTLSLTVQNLDDESHNFYYQRGKISLLDLEKILDNTFSEQKTRNFIVAGGSNLTLNDLRGHQDLNYNNCEWIGNFNRMEGTHSIIVLGNAVSIEYVLPQKNSSKSYPFENSSCNTYKTWEILEELGYGKSLKKSTYISNISANQILEVIEDRFIDVSKLN